MAWWHVAESIAAMLRRLVGELDKEKKASGIKIKRQRCCSQAFFCAFEKKLKAHFAKKELNLSEASSDFTTKYGK